AAKTTAPVTLTISATTSRPTIVRVDIIPDSLFLPGPAGPDSRTLGEPAVLQKERATSCRLCCSSSGAQNCKSNPPQPSIAGWACAADDRKSKAVMEYGVRCIATVRRRNPSDPPRP